MPENMVTIEQSGIFPGCSVELSSRYYTDEKKCDIPFSVLMDWRRSAAARKSRQLQRVDVLYPERFYFYPAISDPSDTAFLYRSEIIRQSITSGILFRDATRAEFVDRSVLTPEYLLYLEGAAKRRRDKREALQRYEERKEGAHSCSRRCSGGLGNIGNNLEKRYPKPVRARRYKIQKFIQDEGLTDSAAVTHCGCNISEFVHLKQNKEHGNVGFGGIATCGSVWACPVCRAKIIQKREKQLKEIHNNAIEAGYHLNMVTLTFRHSKADNLVDLYGSSTLRTGLSGALTRLRQRYFWSTKMKNTVDFVGDIRTVEVTWSEKNGFHPHIHMVLISKKPIDTEWLEGELYDNWREVCQFSGLGLPSVDHGVKVDYIHDVSQTTYLCKWGVAAEMVSSHKEAKKGGFSIAELERCLIDEKFRDAKGITLMRAAGVLQTYYKAMKGQKQLVYGGLNTGWKKELLPDDQTDEEITADELREKEESVLAMIHKTIYKKAKRLNLWDDLIRDLERIPQGAVFRDLKVVSVLKKRFKDRGIDIKPGVHGRATFNRYYNGSFLPGSRERYVPGSFISESGSFPEPG